MQTFEATEMMKLIETGQKFPDQFEVTGDVLYLGGYNYRLPVGLKRISCYLVDLGGYDYPLPAGLIQSGSLRIIGRYNHPLPSGLIPSGDLYLNGYTHQLPAGLTQTCNLYLSGYACPLPAWLTSIGQLDLGGYAHPLPAGLTKTGCLLNLDRYDHLLPAGLLQTGNLGLGGYAHRLPAGLTKTGSLLSLDRYGQSLPAGLIQTGYLDLGGYDFPLPAGLTQTGGIRLYGYKHPLPAGLAQTGELDLNGYKYPLPAGLQDKEYRSSSASREAIRNLKVLWADTWTEKNFLPRRRAGEGKAKRILRTIFSLGATIMLVGGIGLMLVLLPLMIVCVGGTFKACLKDQFKLGGVRLWHGIPVALCGLLILLAVAFMLGRGWAGIRKEMKTNRVAYDPLEM